jgi:hypothetical protein
VVAQAVNTGFRRFVPRKISIRDAKFMPLGKESFAPRRFDFNIPKPEKSNAHKKIHNKQTKPTPLWRSKNRAETTQL